MFLVLRSDKDAYITNKIIDGIPAVSGNTGIAGSLDLFKLYGINVMPSGSESIPQTELSRLLVHFDLEPLKDLLKSNKIDINDQKFNCKLQLTDVYGGQPSPNNFTIAVFPLSASFTEGFGKDVSYYADKDICNFLSSSTSNAWFITGCGLETVASSPGDYITSSVSLPSTKITQFFTTGEEDLVVDVTHLISATLTHELPDAGFRISFDNSLEENQYSYFVKRFGSRHAYNESKRPKLIVRYKDNIEDDSNNFYLDSSADIFMYNYVASTATNLLSASTFLTGSDCVLLEMKTAVSGVGDYSLYFTGSQKSIGSNFLSGVYYASALVPLSDPNIKSYFLSSGSVSFTPIWTSLDQSVVFLTGSSLIAKAPERGGKKLAPQRYTLNAIGISNDYLENEEVVFRVNIFDQNDPTIKAKRLPIILPGKVIRNAYFAVKNISTNEYAIPFDTEFESTKLSSDEDGMYMTCNTSALSAGESYVVEIMLIIDGIQHRYANASQAFRVNKAS